MTTTAEISEVVQQKIKDLPPLPLVVQKLVKTLDDDLSSADDVMKVLSSDQALVSKVLKLVNSSFYGMSGEISTPSRAVVILGFAAIRNLAVGLSVANFMSSSGGKDHMRSFWDHSIAAAAAGQILARRTGYPDPEEAFIAGLLHDIGQMVLDIAAPQDFTKVLADGPEHILANEKSILGLGHAKAGQMLLKHWKLPKPLTDAVRFHHHAPTYCRDDVPLTSLVALADAFASVHGTVYERSVTTPDFLALIKTTGFDLATVGEVLAEMDGRIEETRVFLQIATDTAPEPLKTDLPTDARVVLISTDEAKVTWSREVLTYFGFPQISMKQFLSDPDAADEIDFIILDPGSITCDQLQKIKPCLLASEQPILLLDGDQDGRVQQCLGRTLSTLPLAFSRSDFRGDD